MDSEYLGTLATDDPLYERLKNEVQPQLTDFIENPVYHVSDVSGSNAVCLYEEETTGAKIIGKYFYSDRRPDRDAAADRLEKEFDALETVRGFGFDTDPYYVAKPLAKYHDLNELLLVETCAGELLGDVVSRAIEANDESLLYQKLGALAHFFAALHNRTASESLVNFDEALDYSSMVADQCERFFDADTYNQFSDYLDVWRMKEEMYEDNAVLVHGDATPANFVFGEGENVRSFDLERCLYADRVFDVGRMCGELQHFFLMETGNKYEAEPFIGHFLWEYASQFPDQQSAFDSITRRVPFYMGTTLLRIARNTWLDQEYCAHLIDEAKLCFEKGIDE